MTERLTYKNEDKFYLKWGVDQELDKLSPEVQEIVRGAIEKLGKYEDDEKFLVDRDNNAEWQELVRQRDRALEAFRKYSDKYMELSTCICNIRSDCLPMDELIVSYGHGSTPEMRILNRIREALENKIETPKKPSKNWIFNRFGQR